MTDKKPIAGLRRAAKPGDWLYIKRGDEWRRSGPNGEPMVWFVLRPVIKVARKLITVQERHNAIKYYIENGNSEIKGERETGTWAGGELDLMQRMAKSKSHEIGKAIERADALTIIEVARLLNFEIPKPVIKDD